MPLAQGLIARANLTPKEVPNKSPRFPVTVLSSTLTVTHAADRYVQFLRLGFLPGCTAPSFSTLPKLKHHPNPLEAEGRRGGRR